MPKIDQETLIRIIVEEVLRELAGQGSPKGRDCSQCMKCASTIAGNQSLQGRGLIVCTGGRKLHPDIIRSLKALQEAEIGLSALIADEFEQCVTSACFTRKTGITDCRDHVHFGDFDSFCRQFQFLLLPGLTTEVAVKAVWGILDRNAQRTIVECLRRRFPVLLVTPDGEARQTVPWIDDLDQRWPLWIRENMHQIWRTLLEWGVREVSAGQLVRIALETVQSPPANLRYRESNGRPPGGKVRIFLTGQDVEAMQRAGERKLHLPPNGSLTQEADDLARKYGIKIIYA
jgi:hypothetical protein